MKKEPDPASPSRMAIAAACVFLASMAATLLLWSMLEPDCARPDIAAFTQACAEASSVEP